MNYAFLEWNRLNKIVRTAVRASCVSGQQISSQSAVSSVNGVLVVDGDVER